MQKWIILLVVIAIITLGVYIVSNISIETDYTPEIEIDEKNLRKTIVSLYFLNKENNQLEKESRLIDSKDLLNEPYKKMMELLIKGPENEKLLKIIPDETEITSISLENNVLTIGFSNDFLTVFQDENKKDKAIESISKTLTEFKEVNSINIIIEENDISNTPNA